MKVLFTTTGSPLSRAIRALDGEPVSHTALLYDDNIVIHSNLLGVRVIFLEEFLRTESIIYSVEIPDNYPKLLILIAKYDRAWYDIPGLLYLGWRYLLFKYFQKPLPTANLGAHTGLFMCTELVTQYLDGRENSLVTPYKLYLQLSEGVN